MVAYNNLQENKILEMLEKKILWMKKSLWRSDWLGFCAPLVVKLSLTYVGQQESFGLSRALQQKKGLLFCISFHFSHLRMSFPSTPGLVYGLLDNLQAVVSRDQAAVDAARSQSSLQSSLLLLLGSQDCNDGLIKHRLQALLSQSWTFHVATCTNLMRRQERNDSKKCSKIRRLIIIYYTWTEGEVHTSVDTTSGFPSFWLFLWSYVGFLC